MKMYYRLKETDRFYERIVSAENGDIIELWYYDDENENKDGDNWEYDANIHNISYKDFPLIPSNEISIEEAEELLFIGNL